MRRRPEASASASRDRRRAASPQARVLWSDLRLWSAAGFATGLAMLANAAWATVVPGHALAAPLVALGAAVVAVSTLGAALHPRLGAFFARRGRTVPLVPVVAAAVLAPPRLGPPFWAFLWTLGLFLWEWQILDRLGAALTTGSAVPVGATAGGFFSARMPAVAPRGGGASAGGRERIEAGAGGRSGPVTGVSRRVASDEHRVAAALMGPVVWLALWLVVCDLGTARPALAWLRIRLWPAGLVAGGLLLLASWWTETALLRRARDAGVAVAPGFSARWWWAAVPAIAVSLLVGVLWPRYPAPLQGGGLQALIVGLIGHLGMPPATVNRGLGGSGALVLIVVCVLVLAVAWPGRRLTERIITRRAYRVDPEAIPPIGWRQRASGWWQRLLGLAGWGRRQRTPIPQGRWWPPSPPSPPPKPVAEVWRGPAAPPSDPRARVRAAYGQFLREASSAGVRRAVADTPRRYLRWLLPRATQARFPLESLTTVYEEARFSPHPVEAAAAVRAEADTRAALFGLQMALRQRQARDAARLRWTAPRGASRRNRRGGD